jgi:NADH-quinone oxidoreductase subunit L
MTVPLVILAALSLWFWYSPSPIGEGWFHDLVQEPAPLAAAAQATHGGAQAGHGAHDEANHTAHYLAMALSILVAACGILIAYRTYYNRREEMIAKESSWLERRGLFRTLNGKWYFDELYDATAIRAVLTLRLVLDWFDEWIVDGLVNASAAITRGISRFEGAFDNWIVDGAVNGVAGVITRAGASLRQVQTGRLQSYVVMVLVGILVIMVIRMV